MENIKIKIEDLKKDLYAGELGEFFVDYRHGYIGDVISEIADSQVPIYYSDIWEQAKEHQEDIEEALIEFGTPKDSRGNADLMRIFQQGLYYANEHELYDNLEDSLKFFAYDYIEKELKIEEITEEQNENLLNWDFLDNNETLENLIEHIEKTINRKLKRGFKMKDIEIIKRYYGFNTKDAKYYMKSVSYKTIEAIRKDFEKNAKKNFYDD